jgi:hypothetical protein
MSAWWMPRRLLPMKDVTTPRKALGTGWYRAIQRYPNGATHPGRPGDHAQVAWGALGELKHLSTLRKREDSRSSGERNGRSPNPGSVRAGARCCLGVERSAGSGVPTARLAASLNRTALERPTGGGESPVGDGGRAGLIEEREYHPTRGIGWEAGSTTTQG